MIGSLIRRRILFIAISGMFLLFSMQLFKMQILENRTYAEKSDENSIKGIVQRPPRGIYYDRNMEYLVGNKPSFTVNITPAAYKAENSQILESVLGLDSSHIPEILEKYKKYSKFQPRKIRRNASFKAIAALEENEDLLPGVSYNVEMQRDYTFGVSGSHMFGYTSEIDAQKLRTSDYYSIGDYIGKNGLEKYYEKYLRGVKGRKFIVVDSRQKLIGDFEGGNEDIPYKKGSDLILTIDKPTQIVAEKHFENRRGALVAIEPKTGEILSCVSAPFYDLSLFSSVTPSEIWADLSKREDNPLFNRAIMTRNPPGSTFKMIVALAALEEKLVTPATTVKCQGGFQYGDRFFKCTHVHGKVDLVEAIEKSCNTYFFQLMPKLDLDRLAYYAGQFGLGKKTGIDLDGESSGNLPDKAYYDKIHGKGRWTEGYLISLGIGQGELITTPMQLALYTALVANNGQSKKPHLLKAVIENNMVREIEYDNIEVSGISRKSFELIKEGMYKVVNGEGTAGNIRLRSIEIAGKTGTAQNPHGEDHALFVGFAPYSDPQIAVAVLVENVGYGSTYAAPIVKDVIKTYLGNNRKKLLASNEK